MDTSRTVILAAIVAFIVATAVVTLNTRYDLTPLAINPPPAPN